MFCLDRDLQTVPMTVQDEIMEIRRQTNIRDMVEEKCLTKFE
jgi:hypothetical protein